MSEQNPWSFLGVTTAFENPWFRVEEQEVIDPAGAQRTYGIIRFRKIAVGVLPIDDGGNVHMVGQWRVPLAQYSWEMPEGGCEPGEAPLDCARRELEEEAGVTARSFVKILEMDLSNSVTDEKAVLYLATGIEGGTANPEPVEVLSNRLVPFREVLADVAEGRIRDSLTVAAVLRAYHMAKSGALDPVLAKAMLD